MKIGFFADEFLPRLDGVIVSMLNSAKGLRELGHEVYFIVPQYPNQKTDKYVISVPSSSIPLSDNVRVMRPSIRLHKEIAGLGLDIVHSHTPLTAGIMARKTAAEQNLPHVATFHTLLPVILDYYPIRSKTIYVPSITAMLSDILWSANLAKYKPPASAGRSNSKRWAWRMTGAYADSVDLITSPSKYYAEQLKQLGIDVPVETLSNGLDLSKFSPSPLKDSKKIRVVAVGRLSEEKRQDTLIGAMALLPKNKFELVLVGDGPTKQKLQALAKGFGLDNVKLAGSVQPDKMPALLNKADIGVIASHGFDTQCIALIEYMASGLPVLYCDPHLDEVAGADAALLTDPDAASLAKGLKSLGGNYNLRKKMAKAGVKQSRQYAYQTIAKRLERIYLNLLSVND